MPVDLVGHGARLVLQLLHHGLHGQQVLLLGPLLIHAGDEVAGTDVVEVVVEDVVAADVALLVDHRVGVLLTVLANLVAAVAQVGVEHALKLDAHDVAPLGAGREVEHIRLRRALHLRVGHPLGVVLIGHLRETERAVAEVIVVVDVTRLSGNLVALGNAVEAAVLHHHVVDIADGVEADDQGAILRLLAGDILHIDLAHRGVEASAANLVVLVVEVNLQHGLLALAHLDVLHVDVLDDAAATRVGLDTQYALQAGRVHHAVVGKHILAAAADLGAHDHAAVAVFHLAAADDDVLRRHVALAAVAVAAALDGYAVVAGVEEAVFYQHAVAALRVAAVAVGAVVDHLYTPDGDVGGVQGVDHPEGRAQQRDVLQEYALTLVEAHQLGAQAVLGAEDALRRALPLLVIHRYAVLAVLQQARTGLYLLGYHALAPSELGGTAPRPPGLLAAAAVDGAAAGDGNVGLLEGIDAGREVEALKALPRRLDDGVELGLEGKQQGGALLHEEVDVALQRDGTREERLAGGHDDAAAAFLRAFINGFLDSFLVLGSRVGSLGAKLGNEVVLAADLRLLDTLLYLPIESVVPRLGVAQQWKQQAEQHQV